jgi:hypothetical protein
VRAFEEVEQGCRALDRKAEIARGRKMLRDAAALAFPKPTKAVRTKARKSARAAKNEETARIWEACWRRSGGRCECGCGRVVMRDVEGDSRATLDHWRGRGKAKQSVHNCWILAASCHRERTDSIPTRRAWVTRFIYHCRLWAQQSPTEDRGYQEQILDARDELAGRVRVREAEKARRPVQCPECGGAHPAAECDMEG